MARWLSIPVLVTVALWFSFLVTVARWSFVPVLVTVALWFLFLVTVARWSSVPVLVTVALCFSFLVTVALCFSFLVTVVRWSFVVPWSDTGGNLSLSKESVEPEKRKGIFSSNTDIMYGEQQNQGYVLLSKTRLFTNIRW